MRRIIVVIVVTFITLSTWAVLTVIGQTKVSPEDIESSVTSLPDVLARGWQLPVAKTFGSEITWQSNGSRCGPASVANVFRSVGEQEVTEAAVLDGTGKCWTGLCIMGLSLDERVTVARQHTDRNVSVIRDITPEEFHEHMRHSNDPDRRYIVNFTREKIFGAVSATSLQLVDIWRT